MIQTIAAVWSEVPYLSTLIDIKPIVWDSSVVLTPTR